MTTLFSDTFAGAAGTLAGHAPEVGFGGLSWTTSNMVLNGSGYAGPSNNASQSVYGEAMFGTTNTARGLGSSIDISFTLKTGPVVSGGLDNAGFMITVYANSTSYPLVFGGTADGWASFVNRGAVPMAYPAVTANTEYPCTASITPSGASLTVAGNTTTVTYNAPNASTGLSGVGIFVGGTCLMGSLVIATPPTPTAQAQAPALLGAPQVLGTAAVPVPQASVAAPGLLGAPMLQARHDFTSQLGDAISVYVADLITPNGLVRLPISSWQATLRTGSSCYLQCVIPACSPWVSSINAATGFVVSRRAVLPTGQAVEVQMATAPTEQAQFDRGPERYTCTLSGYSSAFAGSADPAAALDRTLVGLRSVSSGSGGQRVRCAVDWLLRPGQRAFVEGVPMVVGYINYYSPSGFDSYMDVGEQQ